MYSKKHVGYYSKETRYSIKETTDIQKSGFKQYANGCSADTTPTRLHICFLNFRMRAHHIACYYVIQGFTT